MSTNVPRSETAIEPMQPSRLEKNANMRFLGCSSILPVWQTLCRRRNPLHASRRGGSLWEPMTRRASI